MDKRNHHFSRFYSIVILSLGKADADFIDRSIAPTYYQQVVVALIDHALYVFELIDIGSRKKLHACRDML